MRINRLSRAGWALALLFLPFEGVINTEDINLRSDSTTSSKIIDTMKKGEVVDVAVERYDWYRIRLPRHTPSYIKKDLTQCFNYKECQEQEPGCQQACLNARVIKDGVNVRLAPDKSAFILGRIGTNEVVNVVAEEDGWYKIEPIENSYGWVHKKFVDRQTLPQPDEEEEPELKTRVFEGTVMPHGRLLKRIVTHKLVAKDGTVYLLKGTDKGGLDALNYHKVKVKGRIIETHEVRYKVIEIKSIEVVD